MILVERFEPHHKDCGTDWHPGKGGGTCWKPHVNADGKPDKILKDVIFLPTGLKR